MIVGIGADLEAIRAIDAEVIPTCEEFKRVTQHRSCRACISFYFISCIACFPYRFMLNVFCMLTLFCGRADGLVTNDRGLVAVPGYSLCTSISPESPSRERRLEHGRGNR